MYVPNSQTQPRVREAGVSGTCGVATQPGTQLYSNALARTTERLYACDPRGAAFRTMTSLKSHVITHMSDMAFCGGLWSHGLAYTQELPRGTKSDAVGNANAIEECVLNVRQSTGLEFRRDVAVWFGGPEVRRPQHRSVALLRYTRASGCRWTPTRRLRSTPNP